MNGTSTYHDFALLLMLSALMGAVAVRLRQPLRVADIVLHHPVLASPLYPAGARVWQVRSLTEVRATSRASSAAQGG